MYLKHIAIKNIGPISELSIKLPFDENENPKPLILVGENGAGKTIFQSQIIDSFYEIASELFDDVGISNGLRRSYYKVSGGTNRKIGKDKGFSALRFLGLENNPIEYFDKIGNVAKSDLTDIVHDFTLSPDGTSGNQKLTTNISDKTLKEKLQEEWIKGVHIFQPAYRYEEPFWKNDIFKDIQRFEDKRKYAGQLNKEIEIISSTKENKSFLLDLVLDRFVYDENHVNLVLWENIKIILNKIVKFDGLDSENIRFAIGPRGSYRVAIFEKDTKKQLLPSIDNLSLGESILLNLFINIIRHGDNPPRLTTEITGIVAIDEIDVHMHTSLQNTVLPQLIKMFPKIQFIITTHSPLFILGMKKEFGDEGFEIRNMPNGEIITTERFSEFENAYSILKNTAKFEEDINKQIAESHKPIVFVEGDYDIRYIKKASELLNKQDIIEKVTFIDADGYQNLNNIWNHKSNLFNVIPQDMLLLYDCDTKVENKEKNKIYKRIIPFMETNYFDRGIENLFSKDTITKAIEYKKAFIDYTAETRQTKRGEEKIIPEKYDVNPDEKGNLCNWICENGTSEDFKHFDKVFEILKDFLGKSQ